MFTAQDQTTASTIQSGIHAGTQILTLMGARAIETLVPGDRIITRKGAAPLRGLEKARGGFALRFDVPQVVLMESGQVHSETGLPFAA
ncbi:MAG: hypothetical protein AAF393_14525 [Pseudomonadota bacterium]